MSGFGFLCRAVGEISVHTHRRRPRAQQRGVYTTTVHVDTTVTLCSPRRETSSGSRRCTSAPVTSTNPPFGKRQDARFLKTNKEQMKLQTAGEKRNQTERREGENSQGAGTRGLRRADTKPAQLSKHGAGSSPPVGDVVAEMWGWPSREREQEPGLAQESCGGLRFH